MNLSYDQKVCNDVYLCSSIICVNEERIKNRLAIFLTYTSPTNDRICEIFKVGFELNKKNYHKTKKLFSILLEYLSDDFMHGEGLFRYIVINTKNILLFDIAYGKNNIVKKIIFDSIKPVLNDIFYFWKFDIRYYSRIILRLLRKDINILEKTALPSYIVSINFSDISNPIPKSKYSREIRHYIRLFKNP